MNAYGVSGPPGSASAEVARTLAPGAPGTFTSLDVGNFVTCGMTAAGGSYCWGKLRDAGDASDLPVPARTPGGVGFAQVFAGNEYACGLTQAAEADCWGANATGVLGNGTKAYRAIPTRVVGNLRFSSLATAAFHACGLTLDGAAYCWGSNGFTPALKSFYDFVAANYTAVDSIGPMKWTVYRRRTSAFAPLHP